MACTKRIYFYLYLFIEQLEKRAQRNVFGQKTNENIMYINDRKIGV